MQQPHYSGTGWTRACRTGGMAVVWICGLWGTISLASASDLAVESLQKEWHQLFPPPLTTGSPPPVPTCPPMAPFAIASKQFLLGQPAVQSSPRPAISLLRIRNYPPPIRQAHAACVKIITPYWHGAGVMVSSDGDVLTSYHLVAGASAVTVQMLDGRLFATTNVSSFSAVHDLALLHVDGGPFSFLPANRNTAPPSGKHLSIVGHPGELSWKLDAGSVIRLTPESGTDVLHFNADIGPGNSGGPIVDEEGNLCAIAACAATLADGSTVKVGVSTKAILSFLDSPRNPALLADLAAREKNLRTADFLQNLTLLTGEWMRDWLNAMSQVTLSHSNPGSNQATAPRIRFLNFERAAETSLKLLLLKTVMERCLDSSPSDPMLVASSRELIGTLNRLLECTTLLGNANGQTAFNLRLALGQVRQSRAQAMLQFSRAVYGLERTVSALEFDQANPTGLGRLETLRDLYSPPGRHFEISRSEGHL